MNVELVRKFNKRLFTANRGERDFRLENRCVIAAWTSGHNGTPVDGELCQLQVEYPLISVVQNSRATSLWASPIWANHLVLSVMPVVFILQVSAELMGHLRLKLKHPMIIVVLMWAIVHLIANGDMASLYLFGSFALYAQFAIVSANRRGKAPDCSTSKAGCDGLADVIGAVLFSVVMQRQRDSLNFLILFKKLTLQHNHRRNRQRYAGKNAHFGQAVSR
jgi:hypothetical protein